MELQEIMELPVPKLAAARSHLYLWVPNALLMEGLQVMRAWGFTYKSNIVWFKVQKMAGRTGAASAFTFATSLNSSFLASEEACERSSRGERK